MKYSRKIANARLDQRIVYLSTLPERQQRYLDKYKKNLNARRQCIDSNYRVIEKVRKDKIYHKKLQV